MSEKNRAKQSIRADMGDKEMQLVRLWNGSAIAVSQLQRSFTSSMRLSMPMDCEFFGVVSTRSYCR